MGRKHKGLWHDLYCKRGWWRMGPKSGCRRFRSSVQFNFASGPDKEGFDVLNILLGAPALPGGLFYHITSRQKLRGTRLQEAGSLTKKKNTTAVFNYGASSSPRTHKKLHAQYRPDRREGPALSEKNMARVVSARSGFIPIRLDKEASARRREGVINFMESGRGQSPAGSSFSSSRKNNSTPPA